MDDDDDNFFFFVRAWAFFTMRDKVKTLPSRLPL